MVCLCDNELQLQMCVHVCESLLTYMVFVYLLIVGVGCTVYSTTWPDSLKIQKKMARCTWNNFFEFFSKNFHSCKRAFFSIFASLL